MLTLALLLAATFAPDRVASVDDCGVIVAVGQREVAWDADGPNQPFAATPEQSRCNWAGLGVGPPTFVSEGQIGPRFGIEDPIYSKDGKQADVAINFVVWGGPGTHPFISVKNCELRKVRLSWTVVRCTQGLIT